MGFRNPRAQLVRGAGLAEARDIVELALDGHQRGVADRRRRHALAGDIPQAARQQVLLEHGAHGVEVILGGHVQHGVVLVVETPMRVGIVEVALQQILIEIPVRHHVALGIHREEAQMLQEARIHPPPAARIVRGHDVDEVLFEPGDRFFGGEVVDGGRRFAGVDRSAHHHQRTRRGFAARGHQRDRGQHRHRRLADADDVQTFGADMADELLDGGDIIVERERARVLGHHARVDPVGDVHLVVAQQCFHGVAQQGGVMAGQRRHHQHRRVVLQVDDAVGFVRETLETQQAAERRAQHLALHHRIGDVGSVAAVAGDAVDAELRLFVILADAIQQFVAGGGALRVRQAGQPTAGRGKHPCVGFRPIRHRRHPGAAQFVHLIEQHRRTPVVTTCIAATQHTRSPIAG